MSVAAAIAPVGSRQRRVWWVAAGLALLASAGLVQATLAERSRPDVPAALYVRSPEVARRLVLGFDMIAADLYWIRALQNFGGSRLGREGTRPFEQLYPLLDIATTLDPRFTMAHRFGAIFLAEPPPGGPGRPDLAVRLLEKGLRATPNRWQYYQDIGFVHYWWTGDYARAAAAFSKGAALPDAPWWLKSLAAVTLAEGGDRQTSRLLWRALAQTPDNDWLRRDAQRRLTQLDALDAIDELTRIVERARAAGMSAPWSWSALFAAGWLARLPVDPVGTPYVIDLTTGAVDLSRQSTLSPLPREPRARQADASAPR